MKVKVKVIRESEETYRHDEERAIEVIQEWARESLEYCKEAYERYLEEVEEWEANEPRPSEFERYEMWEEYGERLREEWLDSRPSFDLPRLYFDEITEKVPWLVANEKDEVINKDLPGDKVAISTPILIKETGETFCWVVFIIDGYTGEPFELKVSNSPA